MSNPDSAKPAVSIVLPTYERADLIGRSIRSVLAQTYPDFELVVVDDGSTDNTAREVAAFTDPRVRYLRLASNRGAAAARNAGIANTSAELIAFQDSDDEWMPEKLELQMKAFAAAGGDVAVVYCDMLRILRDGSAESHRSPDVVPGVLIDPTSAFYQVCGLGIQSCLIRRPCIAAIGGFDEAFPALEDLELFIRLSQRYRFRHLPAELVRYHETDGLSKNMPAKFFARSLLLSLYGRDLERTAPGFIDQEKHWLDATSRRHRGW